jgi:hypothetical protein
MSKHKSCILHRTKATNEPTQGMEIWKSHVTKQLWHKPQKQSEKLLLSVSESSGYMCTWQKKTCWTMLCAFPISPAFFFSISLDMICGTHFYRIESQSKLNHLPSETKRNVVAEKNLQMSSQIFLLVILGRNHRSSIGKKAWHPQKNCLQRLPKRKATFPFS